MSTEFGQDHGLVHEAVITGRKVGADRDFWAALAHSEVLFAKVVAFVAEMLRLVFTLKAATDRDMTGWECKEPVKGEGEFELELKEFLRKGESYLGGEDMVKRAKELGVDSGLRHLEAVLREQDKIPVEMRQFCLVSTEVWVGPNGDRDVWYLDWRGGRWVLFSYWLDNDFNSSCRLVSPRKYQKS